jgi:hypothetical protein
MMKGRTSMYEYKAPMDLLNEIVSKERDDVIVIRAIPRKRQILMLTMGSKDLVGFISNKNGKKPSVICDGMEIRTFSHGIEWIVETHVTENHVCKFRFTPTNQEERGEWCCNPHAAMNSSWTKFTGTHYDPATDARLVTGLFTPALQTIIRLYAKDAIQKKAVGYLDTNDVDKIEVSKVWDLGTKTTYASHRQSTRTKEERILKSTKRKSCKAKEETTTPTESVLGEEHTKRLKMLSKATVIISVSDSDTDDERQVETEDEEEEDM